MKLWGDVRGDVHRQTCVQGYLFTTDFPNALSTDNIEELLGIMHVQTTADIGFYGRMAITPLSVGVSWSKNQLSRKPPCNSTVLASLIL